MKAKNKSKYIQVYNYYILAKIQEKTKKIVTKKRQI